MASLDDAEQDRRPLSETDAEIYVASVCFKTGPPGKIGVEVERTVHRQGKPADPVSVAQVRDAVEPAGGRLPGGGLLTFEPGGQLEISSACAADLPGVVAATRGDLDDAGDLLRRTGLEFGDLALDALRPPVRTLDLPRYAAMERQFDLAGTAGRTMMCSTASLQVALDAGNEGTGPDGAIARWRHLHALAPVITAMFANSPFVRGAPNGWASNRQAAWLGIDPTRTDAPRTLGEDPRGDWARYALDANVLCIRPRDDDDAWSAPTGLTMRGWLRGEGPRSVEPRDLEYHLTTLFPPVRPRGFLELRVIDAQAGGDWEVATAVVAALVEDPRASAASAEACRAVPAEDATALAAAREGMTRPGLARAAMLCAEAAFGALPRLGADAATQSRVGAFIERLTSRGRSPADAAAEHWRLTGRIEAFDTEHPFHSVRSSHAGI